jgi:hypothetical protein
MIESKEDGEGIDWMLRFVANKIGASHCVSRRVSRSNGREKSVSELVAGFLAFVSDLCGGDRLAIWTLFAASMGLVSISSWLCILGVLFGIAGISDVSNPKGSVQENFGRNADDLHGYLMFLAGGMWSAL